MSRTFNVGEMESQAALTLHIGGFPLWGEKIQVKDIQISFDADALGQNKFWLHFYNKTLRDLSLQQEVAVVLQDGQ